MYCERKREGKRERERSLRRENNFSYVIFLPEKIFVEDVFHAIRYSSFLVVQNLPLDLIVSVFVSGTKLLYIYTYSNLKFLKFEESLDFPYLEICFICTLAM